MLSDIVRNKIEYLKKIRDFNMHQLDTNLECVMTADRRVIFFTWIFGKQTLVLLSSHDNILYWDL